MISQRLVQLYLLFLSSLDSVLHPPSVSTTPYDSSESSLKRASQIKLSKECRENGIKTIERIIHNNRTDDDEDVTAYSGRTLNDLGFYDSCISHQNMTYYLIQAGIDVLRFNLGLCVPDSCTIDDWKQINDAVNDKIWETASIPGSFMNTSGQYFSLNMTNVPASKIEPPIGKEIHLSIWLSLIVLIVSLVLTCSLKQMIKPLKVPVPQQHSVPFESIYKSENSFLTNHANTELKSNTLKERFDTFHQEIQGTVDQGSPYQSKQKIPNLKTVVDSKEYSARSNPFLTPSTDRIQLSFVNIFSLQSNLRSLSHPLVQNEMKNSFEVTLDLVRFTCMIMVMILSIIYVHTMTSKVFTDSDTQYYYTHGMHAMWLQITLYLPDVFLFIGGYVGSKSVYRMVEVLARRDFRDYVFFKREKLKQRKKSGLFTSEELKQEEQTQQELETITIEDIAQAMELNKNYRRSRTHLRMWLGWYIFMVIKRALRFIPLYFIILVFEWKMLPYLAQGPLGATDFNCSSPKLLQTLFFFNTKYAGTTDKMCSPWLWYLGADMQLFLLVPLLVVLFRRFSKYSLAASVTLAVACLVTTFWICQAKKIPVLGNYSAIWAALVMNKSYTRGTCYFIGISLFFYHTLSKTFTKVTSTIKNSKKKRLTQSFNQEILPSYSNLKFTLNSANLEQPLLLAGDTEDKEELTIGSSRRANSLIFEYRGKALICKPTNRQIKVILFSFAGFLTIMILLLNTFALMMKPDIVPQIWHSFFNAFVGPVISFSVVFFFDGLLGLLRVKNRRPFNTKQYNKSSNYDAFKSTTKDSQEVSAGGIESFSAKKSEHDHFENYLGKSDVHVQNPVKAAFLKSPVYLVMKSLCFEVFMVHISLVLLRTFSWPSLSNFDRLFINIIMNGDMIVSLLGGFLVKLFFTKPIENIWRCFETLIVDGDVAGYKHSELVSKYNLAVSKNVGKIDYSSIFKKGTGLESFFERIIDETDSSSKSIGVGNRQKDNHVFSSSIRGLKQLDCSDEGEEEKSTEITKEPSSKSDEIKKGQKRPHAFARAGNQQIQGQSVVTTTTQLSDNFQL